MFSFGKSRQRVVALIDVGSLSIAGGYALLTPSRAPRICYTKRIALPISYDTSTQALVRSLKHGLDSLIEHLQGEGIAQLSRSCGAKHVDEVIVSVGSPWQRIVIRSHSEVFSRPKSVSAELLESFRQTITQELDIDSSTTRLIDHAIIDVQINGYTVTQPVGKRARRLAVTTLASMVPISIHDLIVSRLSKVFSVDPIFMQAAPEVAYVVLRDLFLHEEDFIAVVVTGEATDILLVKKNVLIGVATSLVGVHSVTRSVAAQVGSTVLGESAPHLVADDMLDRSASRQVIAAQERAENEWATSVVAALADLARKYALPQTLFVVSDASCRERFTRLLESEDMHALRLGEKKFTILGVQSQHLTDHIVFTGHAEKDLFLGLLALFFNRMT